MQVPLMPDAWGSVRSSIAVTVPELEAWIDALKPPTASAIF
ncbi:hypothetical protein IMCC1989_518 [gamma proteobacterium IMCC1989]|nr:hypothetical protein IMCC1989_518 [gamma proteobacterium IMCC1989]